jgi:integrase/recombinase XerD
MSNAGIPLRIIQEISGHRTLDELYKYLEVKPEQVKGAIASLSMLTPVDSESFVKSAYNEVEDPKPLNSSRRSEG